MITLSICMIVKNEALNLERCLRSLDSIRQMISCELIIVDTGSEDDTIKIAKSFTPFVYTHLWNQNFSEMRNISLSYAKGRWLFIVDADEVIHQSAGIIEILKNESYLDQVNTLMIKVKDYTNSSDENSFFEYLAPRFFKRASGFHYEGRIHNQPMYSEPIQVIPNALMAHFGYDSQNKALISQKVQRTASMLLRELEEQPMDLYYRYQLSAVYRMGERYEEALKEIEIAYKNIEKSEINISDIYIVKQYILSLRDFNAFQKIIGLENKLNAFIEKDIDLSYYFGESNYKLDQFDKAKDHFEMYLHLLKRYQEDNYNDYDRIDKVQTSCMFENVYALLAEIAYRNSQFMQASEMYLKISIANLSDQAIINYVECLIQTKQTEAFNHFVSNIEALNKPNVNETLIDAVETCIFKYAVTEPSQWLQPIKHLNQYYQILVMAREIVQKGQKLNGVEALQFFEVSFKASKIYYADYLYYALESQQNILEILKRYSSETIVEIIGYLDKKYAVFFEYAIEMLGSQQDESLFRVKAAIEWVLLEKKEIEFDMKQALGIDFILNKFGHFHRIYPFDVLENHKDYLKDPDRIYAYIFDAIIRKMIPEACKNQMFGYYGEIGNQLIEIIELNLDELQESLMSYLNFIDANKLDDPKDVDEMEDLSRQLKQNIRELINQKKYEDALVLINEALSFLISDLELIEMKTDVFLLMKGLKNNL